MIKPKTFSMILGRLFLHFRTEVYSDQDTVGLIETYYDRLKSQDELILERAVDLLIDTHSVKSIPTVAEVLNALSDIKSDMPREQHYWEECPKCQSMGMFIDKSDGLAKACSCSIGQTRRANLIEYDKTHRRFRASEWFNKAHEKQFGI